jgi:hypothetical protein
VLLLGIVQALFEGSMFIFVFMWTPALEGAHTVATGGATGHEALPHGMVFACFMACIMLGSRGLQALLAHSSPELVATGAFAAAACLLAVPIAFATSEGHVMLAFCGFEMVCGMYFPLVGIQRSHIVPEAMRSMLMNVFRIGLNAVVMAVLLNIGSMQQDTVFMLCAGCLTVACAAQLRLYSLSDVRRGGKEVEADMQGPKGSEGVASVHGGDIVRTEACG